MNKNGNNNIIASNSEYRKDDELLTKAVLDACTDIQNRYVCKIPDNWTIERGPANITYKNIVDRGIENGYSREFMEAQYGVNSSIVTDANIIYLVICNGDKREKKPLFIGEMKKQGTNDKRIAEGKKKQAKGNAAGDRACKNFQIAGDYCFCCDKEFFPYTIFFHGCDYDKRTIDKTTIGKLKPFFGDFNVLNPYFNKEGIAFGKRFGGSCFYQKDPYSSDQLYDICYKCCEKGLKHYLKKYNVV